MQAVRMPQEKLLRLTQGGLLGLAAGDALGVPAEFKAREALRAAPVREMRGWGSHHQPPGTWSDDTSMTVCLMESLLHGVNWEDQMQRFLDWLDHAAYTAHGETFDVGNATQAAIRSYARGVPARECGGASEHSCGNGSLMRILPAVLYLLGQNAETVLDDASAEFLHNASRLTHAHPRCLMACGVYASVVFALSRGGEKGAACAEGVARALAYYADKPAFEAECARFARLPQIQALPEAAIQSSGYVLHTLEAALWCFGTTDSYAACALKAVNLGEDTDTTAAVAGSLAGLYYGAEAIPAEWLGQLARQEALQSLCVRFAAAAGE